MRLRYVVPAVLIAVVGAAFAARPQKPASPALRPTEPIRVPVADDPTPTIAAPVPSAPPPTRAGVESSLRDYATLYASRPGPEELRRAEAALERELVALVPTDVVALLVDTKGTLVQRLLLRHIDRGLERDRAEWEAALATGVERAGDDASRLAMVAEIAQERLRGEDARAHAASYLMKSATTDRLLALTGSMAAGEEVAEVRAFLWSKLPAPGAVEGLGHILLPEEANRLGALGPRAEVIRALEIAHARTQDPAFAAALAPLRR